MRKQKTQIDFKKYQTPELVETIVDIISIPGAMKSLFKWAVYGLLGLTLMVGFILWLTGNLTFIWTTLFELYSIPAGTLGGVALGIAEFIRRSLNNMTRLVDLLLETTARIATDIRDLSSGDKEMPPARDLVQDVYEQVILVTLKQAISMVFGFFGGPIYWLYHLTLNQFVRVAIQRLLPKSESTKTAEQLASTLAVAGTATDEKGVVVSSLRWTQDKVGMIGGWLKLLVMIPAYCVLAFIIGIILAPLALTWWWFFSGTPPIEVVPEEPALIWLQQILVFSF